MPQAAKEIEHRGWRIKRRWDRSRRYWSAAVTRGPLDECYTLIGEYRDKALCAAHAKRLVDWYIDIGR